ncbi:hypothetical protein HZS_4689, partial [Henneguya salminicola]
VIKVTQNFQMWITSCQIKPSSIDEYGIFKMLIQAKNFYLEFSKYKKSFAYIFIKMSKDLSINEKQNISNFRNLTIPVIKFYKHLLVS